MATKERRVTPGAQRVLLANPSVVGFAETLRPKLVRGKATRVLAIRVFVEKKIPESRLPKPLIVPPAIGGIPTDVVAVGKIVLEAGAANKKRARPLKGGCSGIYTGGTAATLGYFMRDKKPKKKGRKPQWYALSNKHALDPGIPRNETIQPSPLDNGNAPPDWVGKLFRSDRIDAALSKIDVGAIAAIIGLPTPKGTTVVKRRMVVTKSGRTTGVTKGIVVDTDLTLRVGGTKYEHSFKIIGLRRNFSDGGDSGSLIIQVNGNRTLGLLWGGAPNVRPKPTYAMPIAMVERAFPAQMLVKRGETWP